MLWPTVGVLGEDRHKFTNRVLKQQQKHHFLWLLSFVNKRFFLSLGFKLAFLSLVKFHPHLRLQDSLSSASIRSFPVSDFNSFVHFRFPPAIRIRPIPASSFHFRFSLVRFRFIRSFPVSFVHFRFHSFIFGLILPFPVSFVHFRFILPFPVSFAHPRFHSLISGFIRSFPDWSVHFRFPSSISGLIRTVIWHFCLRCGALLGLPRRIFLAVGFAAKGTGRRLLRKLTPGNADYKDGVSLTGLETCLTSLEMCFALMLSMSLSGVDYNSKPVKGEVSGTVILSPQEASERAFCV